MPIGTSLPVWRDTPATPSRARLSASQAAVARLWQQARRRQGRARLG